MITAQQISGLVLSGGRSSRMQPVPLEAQTVAAAREACVPHDKGLLKLNDRPLVALCCENLKPWVQDIYISANRFADAYSAYGTVLADDAVYGDYQGPLAGIATVLAQISTPWLCVLPVDSPVVPKSMVPRLVSALSDGTHDIAYVVTDRTHPLCMLIRSTCLASLHAYLLSGERRVHAWLQSQRSIGVAFNTNDDVVWNINTPADLEGLRAYLGQGGNMKSGQPER